MANPPYNSRTGRPIYAPASGLPAADCKCCGGGLRCCVDGDPTTLRVSIAGTHGTPGPPYTGGSEYFDAAGYHSFVIESASIDNTYCVQRVPFDAILHPCVGCEPIAQYDDCSYANGCVWKSCRRTTAVIHSSDIYGNIGPPVTVPAEVVVWFFIGRQRQPCTQNAPLPVVYCYAAIRVIPPASLGSGFIPAFYGAVPSPDVPIDCSSPRTVDNSYTSNATSYSIGGSASIAAVECTPTAECSFCTCPCDSIRFDFTNGEYVILAPITPSNAPHQCSYGVIEKSSGIISAGLRCYYGAFELIIAGADGSNNFWDSFTLTDGSPPRDVDDWLARATNAFELASIIGTNCDIPCSGDCINETTCATPCTNYRFDFSGGDFVEFEPLHSFAGVSCTTLVNGVIVSTFDSADLFQGPVTIAGCDNRSDTGRQYKVRVVRGGVTDEWCGCAAPGGGPSLNPSDWTPSSGGVTLGLTITSITGIGC